LRFSERLGFKPVRTLLQIDSMDDALRALKQAFEKLYGYSSDADGIRHALMGDSNVDFEEAKYMLVTCCAFVNYLAEKAIKAGIDLQ